jgi:hypothetical protein
MSRARITGALLEKLGEPAAAELLGVLHAHQHESMEAVMNQCGERFERRLIEETSMLRVEMAQGFAAVRQDMADGRFDVLKWSFIFWVGQLIGVAGIVGMLLRTLPPH